MVSSQVISKATTDFFNDLNCHASKVLTALQESQVKRIHQLVDFERMFKVSYLFIDMVNYGDIEKTSGYKLLLLPNRKGLPERKNKLWKILQKY